MSTADRRNDVYRFAEKAVCRSVDSKTKNVTYRPFRPTRQHVTNIIDATGAVCSIDSQTPIPSWLDGYDGPDPASLVVCANGALDWTTGQLYASDPRLFALNPAPVAFNPSAPPPDEWLRFLDDLFPGDDESVVLLEDWFGYCLTPDTRQDKILLLVGPKRSGKGTICKILRAMLGARNVSSPMMSTIGEPFGLEPLIGTRLAIIEDARLRASSNAPAVAERLLTISGGDSPDIPRKHRGPWRGRLDLKFMLVSNELPNLGDASGTIASRFLVLRTEQTFFGREDLGLFDRLRAELPGILNWSLDGKRRLDRRGAFVQPIVTVADVEAMAELASPVGMFVRECCTVRFHAKIPRAELFDAWRQFCQDEGRDHPGTAATFGQNLHAAVPELRVIRAQIGGVRERDYGGIELRP